MKNPFEIVREFEAELCEYTGAPYAVAVNSCTMAILLAVRWHIEQNAPSADSNMYYRLEVSIPKRTYVSVPMSIIHAGGRPVFRDEDWLGSYQLKPLPVWDSARHFYRNMFHDKKAGLMQCLSFHSTKTLADTQGGAILLDDQRAYEWLKRMRFDGRMEKVSPINQVLHYKNGFSEIGYHCYMSPDVAARLLWKLQTLPSWNDPLPNSDYPDLSLLEIFK